MQIADKNIGAGFRNARQFLRHGAQVFEMPQSKRADRKIEGRARKRKILAVRPWEPFSYRALASGDSQHSDRTINSHSTLAAPRYESLEPPARATSQIEHRFVAKVGNQGQEITFFTCQQRIRGVVIDRSPTLITLRSRDSKGTIRSRKLVSIRRPQIRVDI